MPRRNQREQYEPLDLTPTDLAPRQPGVFVPPPRYSREQTERMRAERERRQRDARLNGGIDWSVCLVPGCGRVVTISHRREHTQALPLCFDHLITVSAQAKGFQDNPLMQAAADRFLERRQAAQDASKAAHLARTDGTIYFVRLNDLVKVGWTRELHQRIKAYGASAVLLACHPGSRDDETQLHRQLRPALAKGREWYESGPIVQRFVDQAIEQHGPPPTLTLWTEPRPVVASKRHR